MLRGEAGLHRMRLAGQDGRQGRLSVAAVRVAAWREARSEPEVASERPIKGATGQYGGRVRARLELANGLVVQSARTLAEARELAADLLASWSDAPPPIDAVVRRYDASPPLVRDALTEWSSGRPDALAPESLHALLQSRVDALCKVT
jgi:hypothetical protein